MSFHKIKNCSHTFVKMLQDDILQYFYFSLDLNIGNMTFHKNSEISHMNRLCWKLTSSFEFYSTTILIALKQVLLLININKHTCHEKFNQYLENVKKVIKVKKETRINKIFPCIDPFDQLTSFPLDSYHTHI